MSDEQDLAIYLGYSQREIPARLGQLGQRTFYQPNVALKSHFEGFFRLYLLVAVNRNQNRLDDTGGGFLVRYDANLWPRSLLGLPRTASTLYVSDCIFLPP
jgi:hypothetical protein